MTLSQHTWPAPIPPSHPARNSSQLIIADPPYNLGLSYADDPTQDHLPPTTYRGWVRDTLTSLSTLLAPGGTLAWICPHTHWWVPGLTPLTLLYGGPIVWYETFSQYQQRTLTSDYRFIYLFSNAPTPTVFNPNDIRVPSRRQELGDRRADPRGRVPGMVWQIPRMPGNHTSRVDWHPTQLPPALLDRLILGWSNPGDTVVDAFAGSGLFLLRASHHSRVPHGFDRSPTYLHQIANRLQAPTHV